MKIIRLLSVFFFSAVLLASCEEFDQQMQYSRYENDGGRTLIVYLAMHNNSLATPFGEQNVKDILAGSSAVTLSGGRILIYAAFNDPKPAMLLEVKVDKAKPYLDTLARYETHDSVDPAVFRRILDQVKEIAPSDSYGLVIGSHGTGWLPPKSVEQSFSTMKLKAAMPVQESRWQTRTAMNDAWATEMTVENLAAQVGDGEFDYILFDVCLMGQAEVVYAMRHKAHWIIASPTETLSYGMPYKGLVGDLMAPAPRLAAVCSKYYAHYNAPPHVNDRSGTIALYDCTKMDALAAVMRRIAQQYSTASATGKGAHVFSSVETSQLQRFSRYNISTAHVMFDMADFVHTLIPLETDPLRGDFDRALADVVLYKAATTYILYPDWDWFSITTYCGMGVYVPTDGMGLARNNNYYTTTEWGKYVYGN